MIGLDFATAIRSFKQLLFFPAYVIYLLCAFVFPRDLAVFVLKDLVIS